nr:hypothetical protein [Pseudomonas sp. NCCP-436]
MTIEKRVIYLHQRAPQEALTRLNRITGLSFARWPESLLDQVSSEQRVRDEELVAPVSSSGSGVSSG